jgi:hypothetical protein
MLTNSKCVFCLALGAAGLMSGFLALVSRIYPFALAALVLAPCAVVLGFWGTKEIRRAGRAVRGKKAAEGGICCSILDVILLLLLPVT